LVRIAVLSLFLAGFVSAQACGPSSSSSSSPVVDAGADSSAADAATCASGNVTVDPASTPKLAVANDRNSTNGIFDPSLIWPPGSTRGFLSYTSLGSSALFTRIATTTDGTTFTYAVDANAYADLAVATTDTTVCNATSCNGRMVHETSSLIYDATDPDASRRFKLFDYSYVIVPAAASPAQHAWGYIGLYTSASGDSTWSSGTKAIGWASTATSVSSDGAEAVLTNTADLSDCAAFTEPAAIVDVSGNIDLALGCVSKNSGNPVRVVLVTSTDHAKTFSYVGVLLTSADGPSVGSNSTGVQPTDLFQDDGDTYLIVSTLGTTPTIANSPAGYVSCTTIAVSDLASAKVERDASNNPVVVRKLTAPGGTFTGACAFKSEFAAGYLVPQVVASASPANEILESGLRCP
jgi:hypothetical protein